MTPVTTTRAQLSLVRRTMTVLLLAAVWPGTPAFSQDVLTIAAAADLQPLMQEVVSRYKQEPHNRGTKISLVFGSSGNLTTQIENGAPYDLFFSANEQFARRLIANRHAISGSFRTYAAGKLAIWVPPGSKLDLDRAGAKALLDPAVHQIAIANPQHAPYGQAAIEALKHFGLYDAVASKLVLGENVSQAAQFVVSGNAQAGIFALSLALAPPMKSGHFWIVPGYAYAPLRQAAVVVAATQHPATARAFLDFFLRQRSLLSQFGFDVPPAEEQK